jgi:hypothetical protein
MEISSSIGPSIGRSDLFQAVFGDIANVKNASQIGIDEEGHIERVAKNILYKWKSGTTVEDLKNKVHYQERNIKILVGVCQLLRGEKSSLDKETKEIAKKIHKHIEEILKHTPSERQKFEREQLEKELETFTSKLIEANVALAKKALLKEHQASPGAATITLGICKETMEGLQKDLSHVGADIGRYLASGHLNFTTHSGQKVLEFQLKSPPEGSSPEVKQAYDVAQKFDRLLHFLLMELDVSEGKTDFDKTDQIILKEWNALVLLDSDKDIAKLTPNGVNEKIQKFFEKLVKNELPGVDSQKARNLAHLLMGLNQVNFVTPSQGILLSTKDKDNRSILMPVQAYNYIDYNINKQNRSYLVQIRYTTKFVDIPEDRRKTGTYDSKVQVDYQLTQRSQLDDLDHWKTELELTVLTPTAENRVEKINENFIGEIIQKLKLNGYSVKLGTAPKTINLG